MVGICSGSYLCYFDYSGDLLSPDIPKNERKGLGKVNKSFSSHMLLRPFFSFSYSPLSCPSCSSLSSPFLSSPPLLSLSFMFLPVLSSHCFHFLSSINWNIKSHFHLCLFLGLQVYWFKDAFWFSRSIQTISIGKLWIWSNKETILRYHTWGSDFFFISLALFLLFLL